MAITDPIVSAVLGTYNRLPFLKLAIASVRVQMEGLHSEIVVVDGGSTDGTISWLSSQPDIITIVQHNRSRAGGSARPRESWGYFMNLGFKCARGEYILMISDDCLVVPGSVHAAFDLFEAPKNQSKPVGGVAFYWRNWPEDLKYKVGLTLGRKMFVNHGMFLRRAIEHVGYIDEKTYRFYHADGDLSLKLWSSGYEIVDSPRSHVEHYSHANRKVRRANEMSQARDWQAYVTKWTGVYYMPENPFEGGWIEQDYRDAFSTCRRFLRRHYANPATLARALKRSVKKLPLVRAVWSYVKGTKAKG